MQVKVMAKQQLMFHNAVSAYFSGNQAAEEESLKQFAGKVEIWSISFSLCLDLFTFTINGPENINILKSWKESIFDDV